jgi:hypothetical protein
MSRMAGRERRKGVEGQKCMYSMSMKMLMVGRIAEVG